MKKNVYLFLGSIFLISLGFFSGIFYVLYQGKKYQEVKIGSKLNKIENTWGTPYITNSSGDEIIHTYKDYMNKYVFIYNKKDSLLIEKWKEN